MSVVLTNMPMVYPLVKRFFEKGLSSIGGESKSATNAIDSHGYRLGSNPGRDRKTNNSKHPLSIPNETCWGSEENIVGGDGNADAKTPGTSSGDEATMPLPLQGLRSGERRVSVGAQARSGRRPSNGKLDGDIDVEGGRGIVVTQEYTVTEQRTGARTGPSI